MTCLKSADPPSDEVQKSAGGSIQVEPPRTFGYIYQNLMKGKDTWAFPLMFFLGLGALGRMILNGLNLYVLR